MAKTRRRGAEKKAAKKGPAKRVASSKRTSKKKAAKRAYSSPAILTNGAFLVLDDEVPRLKLFTLSASTASSQKTPRSLRVWISDTRTEWCYWTSREWKSMKAARASTTIK